MSRLRRSSDEVNSSIVADAVEVLRRDGVASVTVEPFADLTLTEARDLAGRWTSIPESLRQEAIAAMASLASEDVRLSFERAFTLGLRDSSPSVRLSAVNALWEAESSSLLANLLELTPTEPDVHVRDGMVEALGRFARRASEGLLAPDQARLLEEVLVERALHDDDDSIRLGAMVAAAFLRPERLEPEIREAFDVGHDEAVEMALRAMGRFGGARWASRVIDALRAGDVDQRSEAASAAPYVEDRRVLPYLYEAAEDDDYPELQVRAIQALGEIGGPAVQSFLESFRDSTTGDLANAAEAALENAALLEGSVETSPIH